MADAPDTAQDSSYVYVSRAYVEGLKAERDALRAVADAAIDWFEWTAFRPLSNRDPLERLHHAVNAYHEGGR
jgi:hypothetical protein